MSHPAHLPAHHDRTRGQWWFIFIAAPLALVLGTIGFWRYDYVNQGGHASVLSALYYASQLFILHAPHLDKATNVPLELGRWLAAAVFGVAAISAVYRIFAGELRRFWFGFAKGHVVICGLGRKGLDLVRCYRSKPRCEKVVVIDREAPPELIAACHTTGATLILGDVTDPAVLREARVHHAKLLVAACGEDETNVEVAVRAHQLVHSSQGRSAQTLQCFVQLTDIDLRGSFQRNKLLHGAQERWEVHFFDVYESNTRKLLLETLPLDHSGLTENDHRQVHLVILGFGRMGRSVALKAVQLGHFANRKPLKISVVDRDARRHEQELLFRYPAFRQVCNIGFDQLEVASLKARNDLESWCDDCASATSVAICFDNDALALDVALRLLPKLRARGVPVAVRMSSNTGLATLLNERASPKEVSYYIRTFGSFDHDTCEQAYNDAHLDSMAKLIQLRFIEKGVSHGRTPDVDGAVRAWNDLAEDYKDSNRQQADHLQIKLRAIGCEIAKMDDPRPEATFSPGEIELLAELEHRRWVAERTLAGYTHAAGLKNEEQRTNPNLKPWDQLDDGIKDYDRDTIRNIPYLLKAVNKKVCRKNPII